MKDQILYIHPQNDEYTGYSIYVVSGTSTSDLGSFYMSQDITKKYNWAIEDKPEEDLADRLEFYETKIL